MPRIALIEDDETLRSIISEKLAAWGHEVFEAADGAAGYEIIVNHYPDLVLSDVNMPEVSGLDLVRSVSVDPHIGADMPFVFMSSAAEPDEVILGLNCGADDYLAKPINYEILKTKINAHLRRRDSIIKTAATQTLIQSIWASMVRSAFAAGAFAMLGVATLLCLYWIKAALGIDLVQNYHFSELF